MASNNSHETLINSPPGTSPVNFNYEKKLREKIGQLLNLNTQRFPGAQPISLVAKNLKDLENEDFFVSEKSDGTRYLMFITVTPTAQRKMVQEVFLVDRKYKFHFVKMFVPRDFRKPDLPLAETLIDGELVLDKQDNGNNIYRFLAFDLLAYDGKVLTHRDFMKRLGYLKEFVLRNYNEYIRNQPPNTSQNAAPFTMELKSMERSYGTDNVVKSIKDLKHGNDGLIYTAVSKPYIIGTCQTMLKWKPPEMNSVDFRIRVKLDKNTNLPKWTLHILKNRDITEEYGELVLQDEKMQAEWLEDPPQDRIVECYFDPEYPTKWKFMRFREDKDTPNHISVVPRIMESISEGVSLDELCNKQRMDRIKQRWSEREKARARAHAPIPSNAPSVTVKRKASEEPENDTRQIKK